MRTLQITNKCPAEAVTIDARLSNADLPFDDLQPVSGFPRSLAANEEVKIAVGEFSEVLYRRSTGTSQDLKAPIYRIEMAADEDDVKQDLLPAVTGKYQ